MGCASAVAFAAGAVRNSHRKADCTTYSAAALDHRKPQYFQQFSESIRWLHSHNLTDFLLAYSGSQDSRR
ncbi:hypothetical protein BMYO_1502 [Bifidobacterium myosotis]|uniref:Uncharacterized protein n=1 Tax=Bifidobacterium myosotis TaxID=1630166 RepID=A0A261FII2_9BIFI|nr:hypothetical protein BMYO_1502 [Bifidobacterium myosotis]